MGVEPADLTPRLGKCLRYVCARKAVGVLPKQLVTQIEWSDLPHTLLQARATLERLRALKLAERSTDGYRPTQAGESLIRSANKKGLWNS